MFLLLSVVELRLRNRGPEGMPCQIGDRENWPVLPRSHFILRQDFPGKPGPFRLGCFQGLPVLYPVVRWRLCSGQFASGCSAETISAASNVLEWLCFEISSGL